LFATQVVAPAVDSVSVAIVGPLLLQFVLAYKVTFPVLLDMNDETKLCGFTAAVPLNDEISRTHVSAICALPWFRGIWQLLSLNRRFTP
jgi:hypothetical protein